MKILLGTVIVLALLALAPLSSARTDRSLPCSPESTINGTTFAYTLCDLPDLDQIRQQTATTPGLPGDGFSYCVPTATMDALAYIASHGATTLRPGDKDWTDPANYNEMTQDIHDLGDLMGTTPSGGTTDGYTPGLTAWLQQTQPGVSLTPIEIIAGHKWATSPGTSVFAPTLLQMADDGITGRIVTPNIVFMQYMDPPAPATGPKQWLTVGGHVIAMSSAHSPNLIGLHDPAVPFVDHAYQTTYAEETYTLTPVTSTFGYIDGSGDDVSFTATLLRVDDYALNSVFGAGTQAYIWGYTYLEPVTVGAWHYDELELAVVKPGDPVERFALEGPLVDLAIDPTRAHDFYAVRGSSTIWDLDRGNGESTSFVDAGIQPDAIAFAGRSRSLFVAGAGQIGAFNFRARRIGAARVPEAVDALAVDQETGNVFALSAKRARVRVFDSDLNQIGILKLPHGAFGRSGKASMTVRGEALYVHGDGSQNVAVVPIGDRRAKVRLVKLKGAKRPNGLGVSDAGHIFVQNAGLLAEYLPSGRLADGSVFNGIPVGPGLAVPRSFSTAAPAAMHFIDSPLPPPPR